MDHYVLNKLIDLAIAEDLGDGDHTSLSCIPKDKMGKARLLVKQEGVLAGVEISEFIFSKIDKEILFKKGLADGTKIKKGDIAFQVSGRSQSILQAERLVLNILQRMSGIATETARYVDKLHGLHTKILDTRKTTPNFRLFEKEAVRIGGGENHRFGLYDMIMIKDNHIDFAGGIEKAINAVHEYLAANKKVLKIEIEARTIDDVERILQTGSVHRIMLDNFNIQDTKYAVKKINGLYETESSGGITMETLRSYAECGVDYISVGALTHQIKSLDLSLKAVL